MPSRTAPAPWNRINTPIFGLFPTCSSIHLPASPPRNNTGTHGQQHWFFKSCFTMYLLVEFANSLPAFQRIQRVLLMDVLVYRHSTNTRLRPWTAPEPISAFTYSIFQLPDAVGYHALAFTIRSFHLVWKSIQANGLWAHCCNSQQFSPCLIVLHANPTSSKWPNHCFP